MELDTKIRQRRRAAAHAGNSKGTRKERKDSKNRRSIARGPMHARARARAWLRITYCHEGGPGDVFADLEFVNHNLQGRHEELVANHGEAHERVDHADDVDDDAAVGVRRDPVRGKVGRSDDGAAGRGGRRGGAVGRVQQARLRVRLQCLLQRQSVPRVPLHEGRQQEQPGVKPGKPDDGDHARAPRALAVRVLRRGPLGGGQPGEYLAAVEEHHGGRGGGGGGKEEELPVSIDGDFRKPRRADHNDQIFEVT